MDNTQAILIAIVIILAILLIAIGTQAFFVLRDFQKSLIRANMLFDEIEDLVDHIKRPVESIGNLTAAITTGAGIAHLIKRITEREKQTDKK